MNVFNIECDGVERGEFVGLWVIERDGMAVCLRVGGAYSYTTNLT